MSAHRYFVPFEDGATHWALEIIESQSMAIETAINTLAPFSKYAEISLGTINNKIAAILLLPPNEQIRKDFLDAVAAGV